LEGRMKTNLLLLSVLSILIGIVLIAFPETTMITVGYVFAGCLIILGLVYVIAYFRKDIMEAYYQHDLVIGLVLILIAVCSILKVTMLIELIPIIMGIVVFTNGIIKLQHAIDLKRAKFGGWVYVLVFAILCISIGVILLAEPFETVKTFMRLIGVGFVFGGVTDIITLYFLTKCIKNIKIKRAEEDNSDELTENSCINDNTEDTQKELNKKESEQSDKK